MMLLLASLLCQLFFSSSALALELPPLKPGINDLAGMFPQASLNDLEQRLHRFKTESANSIVILTVKDLDGDRKSTRLNSSHRL